MSWYDSLKLKLNLMFYNVYKSEYKHNLQILIWNNSIIIIKNNIYIYIYIYIPTYDIKYILASQYIK